MKSYDSNITVKIISNKNENTYVINQTNISNRLYKQEILEPENIKGVIMTKESDRCKKLEHRTFDEKHNYVKRLNRIEGQVRGINKMIEEDRYLSQNEIAKILNCSQTTYSIYETGDLNISVGSLIK